MKFSVAIGVPLLALAALAGCTGAPPTHTASSSSPASSLGITCEELVPAPVRDALHPNLAFQPSFTPEKGSGYAATIVSLGGMACLWQAPDKITLEVAIAKLSSSELATQRAQVAAGSTSTLVFGDSPEIKGYNVNSGGTYTGDMEVFTEGGYWVSALSVAFLSPSDAESVVAAALQAVPSG